MQTDDNNTATNPLAYATTRLETWRRNDEIALNNIATNNSYTSGVIFSYSSSPSSSGRSSSSSTVNTIRNKKNDILVTGTALKDNIYNSGSGVTIDGGDGNDLIQGFNATSTLRIGNGTGTYSTTKSSSNIIVTVSTGKITL